MTRKKKPDRLGREPLHEPLHQPRHEPENDAVAIEEIDRILARLDVGIAEERKQMDELLARLRTTRIAA
jgi:hypothetical protein